MTAATTQVDESSPTATQTPPARRPMSIIDAPMRAKMALLLLLAAAGGCFAELANAQLDHPGWPLLAGVTFTVATVVLLARRWILQPMDDLRDAARRALLSKRPIREAALPLRRADEIGELARLLNDMALHAYRNTTEANRLRRTLDLRVEQATRSAIKHLEALAMRDSLTDLGNRRFLDEHLATLIESCLATKTDLHCVMIDMDNFKAVNDELGHAAGDKMITFLGHLLKANARTEDYTVRLGGDEFVVIMPGVTRSRVREFIEHVVGMFNRHMRTVLPPELPVGISAGVSSLRQDSVRTASGLLEAADNRLYEAKETGKGRIVGVV